MAARGHYPDAQLHLAALSSALANPADKVESLAFEALALAHLHQYSLADARLAQAGALCSRAEIATCGLVPRVQGVLAVEKGEFPAADKFFGLSLAFARAHHDQWLEASALSNLGAASLGQEHLDEAADWSRNAYRTAKAVGAEDLAQRSLGNLGWAFFGMGDSERSLQYFLDAENTAVQLGDQAAILNWLTTAGIVYQQKGDFPRATESFRQALTLARQISSKEDIVNSLEDLAHVSIEAGKIDEAERYLQQLAPLVEANGNRLDTLDVIFAKGRIASMQHRGPDAELLFHVVERDPASQTSMRMGAEHELAVLYEAQGNTSDADRMYRTALSTFESARDQLKDEDSKLPFLTNAAAIYDGYVQFLVAHGHGDEALDIADESRAQTLAQGLNVGPNKGSFAVHSVHPTRIARKTHATLFFYWLGEKQSYLWAVTPNRTALFPLPPQHQIEQAVARYREVLLGFADPVEHSNSDGIALYRMLIAPAANLLTANAHVVILSDGALSQFNFETLIVPDAHPHYWIEDADLVSAPSLRLLASAADVEPHGGRLLLFGDAVSPNPDYPELPMAAAEMQQIKQHFGAQNAAVYAREHATAAAYLGGNPQQFAYIHFVAHGVANNTDPLDSAIILSRATSADDSFKLHAREIIQHPIHARLVTISACYGSGTRTYAGEGSVGLAWAFLRAGAHNVIGALWEVSDDSTSQLMGNLYQNLESGLAPSASLRQAKLSLLYSGREFRKPFYWAPFQIYTGL
jgi:CHAT domain-containing protein/Tfp pilus assembly protein PilF